MANTDFSKLPIVQSELIEIPVQQGFNYFWVLGVRAVTAAYEADC